MLQTGPPPPPRRSGDVFTLAAVGGRPEEGELPPQGAQAAPKPVPTPVPPLLCGFLRSLTYAYTASPWTLRWSLSPLSLLWAPPGAWLFGLAHVDLQPCFSKVVCALCKTAEIYSPSN